MKIKLVVLLLFPLICFSQERILKGKITADAFVSGILVVNLTKETQVLTDGFGRFSIIARPDDLLIFSATHLHRIRHLVEEEDFDREISIEMESIPYEIETVEIERINITSESLGLIPKGQKRYTVAERRLYSSQSGGPIGSLIDIISGRRKILKMIYEIEKENQRINYLSKTFPENFYTETLKIHPDNITEFKFYALYQMEKDLSKQEKDTYIRKLSKKELELKLIPLAESYLKLKEEG